MAIRWAQGFLGVVKKPNDTVLYRFVDTDGAMAAVFVIAHITLLHVQPFTDCCSAYWHGLVKDCALLQR